MTAFMHAQGPESIKDDCKGLFFPLCEGGGGTWLFKPGFHWSEAHGGGISPNHEAQPVTCPKCLKMMAASPRIHRVKGDALSRTVCGSIDGSQGERVTSNDELVTCVGCRLLAFRSQSAEPSPADSTNADIMVTIFGIALIELAHLPRRFVNTPGRKWNPHECQRAEGEWKRTNADGSHSPANGPLCAMTPGILLDYVHPRDTKPPMEDVTDLVCEEK